MSDEAPQTFGGAVRAYVAALGFIITLVGADMMAERDGARFVVGIALVIAGLPVFTAAALWKVVQDKLSENARARLGIVAKDPRGWLISFLVASLPLGYLVANDDALRQRFWFAEIVALLIFLAGLWIGIGWVRGFTSKATKSQVVQRLADLFAEGVGHRNDVSAIADHAYDYNAATSALNDWDGRVSLFIDERFFTVSERSRFRTLDRFTTSLDLSGYHPKQAHLIAMWNEKLDRLKALIDRAGK
jgi:hypothetical protein